ncbi:receptor protein-tyrosine kinase [Rhodoferax ferrireducens]|uniref:Receptor protein-tyrosine kinase n=1 Tax=Rhodoferax ferrireducens TaxID=192843 RepID=A0ABU2C6H2_9BURK|nr:chain length determinant protein tyrosine kinase EpsG [Rhodoferax ferrireducens]MDR7376906.1 receptor protein-tyrosine kinase [Rhodoferax ferrireducens]
MNAPVPRTTGASRSIGDILVASGRLTIEDAARVVERQQKDNVQFGEAAIALKVLTKDDIDFALSKQFDYSYLRDGDFSLSPELIAAYKPFSRVGENLRAVRSQLMLRWFSTDTSRKVLAVVSAGRAEGKSFLAGNLAVVFAQQGQRTLLIDGDLRAQPGQGQHGLFKLGKNAGLSGVLAGRAGLEAAQLIPGLPGLAILSAGAVPPNPQELLGRATFGDLLNIASHKFDVVIIDTPPSTEFADAEIIASRAGAALLVARKNQSRLPQTVQLARRLQDSGVALVGSVLNDT